MYTLYILYLVYFALDHVRIDVCWRVLYGSVYEEESLQCVTLVVVQLRQEDQHVKVRSRELRLFAFCGGVNIVHTCTMYILHTVYIYIMQYTLYTYYTLCSIFRAILCIQICMI